MHILISPLHHVKKHRARRKKLRTVLHMLSASGVIRPSHIEPRYFEPSSHVDALYRHPTPGASTPSTRASIVRRSSMLDGTTFHRFLTAVSPSRLQTEP
jgi:hypothetical protein